MKKSLFFAALCLCSMMSLAATPIRLMSFNIRLSAVGKADGENRWENRRQAVGDMLCSEQPHAFGLQEADYDQVCFVDSVMTGYQRIGNASPTALSRGEANPIYFDTTRLKLIDNGLFWLSTTPTEMSKGWDAGYPRTCNWAEFEVIGTGERLVYLNTHLDNEGAEARKQSVLLITERIKALTQGGNKAFVLSADFNTPATDVVFDPLKAIAQEARQSAAVCDRRPTFNAFGLLPADTPKETLLIDHFFCSPKIMALRFDVHYGPYAVPYLSDHYAITVSFML